ncbi:MAG: hypothetical protein H6716_23860 [Polyangiaceae bacterium]|nr:hypothetical protein [Polyangiaceae bacterium]
MARADLLALTAEDLAALTNRGTVKRAQKELQSDELEFQVRDADDGDLVVVWSNGVSCTFVRGKTIKDAICTSGLNGITRHVIRSVLAYQSQQQADASGEPGDSAPSGPASSWDPGQISDEQLEQHFGKAAVSKARRRFEAGVLLELIRGAKPTVRFLEESITLRFLVEGDLGYVTGDCAERQLSLWCAVAVWGFRELSAEKVAGIVSVHQTRVTDRREEVSQIEELLDELGRDGFAGLAPTWRARCSRAEAVARKAGLIWPAEIMLELLEQQELYVQRDARFEPRLCVELLGELTARCRAIANSTTSIPQALIRGSQADSVAEIAGGRMIGLGLGIVAWKRHATLSVYLQDADLGSVMSVERSFAEEDADKPARDFETLAATSIRRNLSLAGLTTSQLLLKAGKRTPSGRLLLPRGVSSMGVNPQDFQWEQLKAPLAADSFAQLQARYLELPPSYLRPRRRTENLHVVALARASEPGFEPAMQVLTATLHDTAGGRARLVHPYHDRGRAGFGRLLRTLTSMGEQVRYVCGHVRSVRDTLELQPVSLIYEHEGRRLSLLPWIADANSVTPADEQLLNDELDDERDPVADQLQDLRDAVADALLMGVRQAPAAAWLALAERCSAMGFVRLADAVAALGAELEQRSASPRWKGDQAARKLRELCLVLRIALE